MPVIYEPYYIRRYYSRDIIEYTISPSTGCWEPIGRPFNLYDGGGGMDGYCRIRRNGRSIPLHRYVFELFFGEIPEGLFVCHHCDNPRCCNPYHLFLGTNADNMQDAVLKGRIFHGERELTEADAQAILEDRMYSLEYLAQKYGVGIATIRNIKDRKSWRHLTIKS